MKKLFMLIIFLFVYANASLNLQTATKEELMSIKGIGEKKALLILQYRESNTIKSVDDLRNIKGFGDTIINNIKNDSRFNESKKEDKEAKNEKGEKANKPEKTDKR